jgi:hypothetical protein
VLWKLPLSGHRAHGLTCCRLDPVANGTNRATCDVCNSIAIEGKADVTRAAVSVAIDPTLPYQRLHKISTCGVGLAATLMGRSRAVFSLK